MDLKLLGQRMRQARERLGLSQEEFANLVSKDQTAISEYENGKRKVFAADLPLFAQALNVSLLYFFEGETTASDVDRALLAEFHRLPEEYQAGAIEILRVLADISQK